MYTPAPLAAHALPLCLCSQLPDGSPLYYTSLLDGSATFWYQNGQTYDGDGTLIFVV